jgi:hypothetical protein
MKIRPGAEEVGTPDVDGWEETRNDAIRETMQSERQSAATFRSRSAGI